jgi:hypothetical protein
MMDLGPFFILARYPYFIYGIIEKHKSILLSVGGSPAQSSELQIKLLQTVLKFYKVGLQNLFIYGWTLQMANRWWDRY